MSEHTPGPWSVVEAHNNTQVSAVLHHDGSFKGIADIFDSRDGTPEYRANARLIAAAPDMLAALEAIVQAAEDGDDPEVIVLARVAIAKATSDD